jgi:aminopeptidase N
MAWWDDIWLNEGFATRVEVLAMDHLFPEWSPWEEFAATNVAYAMELDGLANTHPIQVPVDDPRSLDEIFDAISYSKGASIIDMLHHYLGAEVFKKGLQTYLNRHKFGNTVTHDLWKALGDARVTRLSALKMARLLSAGFIAHREKPKKPGML